MDGTIPISNVVSVLGVDTASAFARVTSLILEEQLRDSEMKNPWGQQTLLEGPPSRHKRKSRIAITSNIGRKAFKIRLMRYVYRFLHENVVKFSGAGNLTNHLGRFRLRGEKSLRTIA